MIIESDYLTEGLFGQVFIWMLETLPYLESKGCQPEWRIRARNYGQPPGFNIFPGIIQTNYAVHTGEHIVSFEDMWRKKGVSFQYDFRKAGHIWNSYFRFTEDVHKRLNDFWKENFEGETVLGLHYRGTDKNVDNYQTNPVSMYQYICVVEDFLRSHSEVTAIFLASDDQHFINAMSRFPNVKYYNQTRSEDDQPLWNHHDASQNQAVAKEAILDCLTLSRCRYGLKCMSQLSAFSKVFNPELEVYRIAACKPGWFPEAYIPTYRSESKPVQSLLKALQQDDFQESTLARTMGIHRRTTRLIKKVWQRRNNFTEKLREINLKK